MYFFQAIENKMTKTRRQVWWQPCSMILAIIAMLLVGCSGSKESKEDEAEVRRVARTPEPVPPPFDMKLHAASEDIRSIQIYYGNDERSLPIAPLRVQGERTPDNQISLEFDLMGSSGRPLSAYFYHADRTWNRDLSPPEYLTGFQREDIFDYTLSRGTDTPYFHYTYRFPNSTIGFRVSGNYIIRITEQGKEDEVLFERAFFITEQATSLEMGSEQLMVGGRSFPATIPIVQFMPPASIAGNVFDYNVCFVRNGRYETARCTDQAELAAQPLLRFQLDPEVAFEPDAADYYLDFRDLRVGGQIENINFSDLPYQVTLEPDYASFPASRIAPLLNGQPVISTALNAGAEPDYSAEYALVGFSFVPPDESPLSGDVLLAGSFNGWQRDAAPVLEWVPENGRYETNMLLKQGEYEYQYFSNDRRLQNFLKAAPPRLESLYTAFIYYSDISVSTDRLLGVTGLRTR